MKYKYIYIHTYLLYMKMMLIFLSHSFDFEFLWWLLHLYIFVCRCVLILLLTWCRVFFSFPFFRMAYGTEYGLVIIDIIQKSCLLSVACPDLYGAHDPYSRTPKSPKRIESKEEQSRSPSSDQVSDGWLIVILIDWLIDRSLVRLIEDWLKRTMIHTSKMLALNKYHTRKNK